LKVLILGVNGFIGNALTHRILETTDWEVYGMDLSAHKLGHSLGHPRFRFVEGDIGINREWIEYHVKKCDVVLPLVAIATPALYVRDPLRVFELDFEENLKVVRQIVRYRKRLVFPSTSEVYGMSPDVEFDEESSPLVLGPIHKHRWIYACSKQLLDRVIAAYGLQQGLRYTLFRPFNWIGPKLDDINAAKEGSSRVATQFIWNLMRGEPILLVDGGRQRRCFLWVEDGVDGLMKILADGGERSNGGIFNLGNPDNECSVRELGEKLAAIYVERRKGRPDFVEPRIETIDSDRYYGAGYQDMLLRKPSIERARTVLGWQPQASLDDCLRGTFDAFAEEWDALDPAARGESSD